MMRAAVAAIVALGLFGAPLSARAAEPVPEPRKSRSLSSVNALWSLQMVETAPGTCRLEATKDREIAWTLERCVGSADDLYFISNDGQRFWVLHTLPEKPPAAQTSSKKVKSKKARELFRSVVVAAEHGADGTLRQTRRVAEFIPAKRIDELKPMTKRFKWLEGAVGERGVSPRLTPEGWVAFETLDGTTHRLPLETPAK